MFRSCTALLSSNTFGRSARCQSRRLLMNTRRYSDTPKEGTTEEAPSEVSNDKETANGESPPESELASKLKAKEAEVVDLTGRLRYLQADFLNFQRNAAREKEQTRDFAITNFSSDLLETVDVLALALKSVPPPVLAPIDAAAESTPTPSIQKPPETYLRELHHGVDMTHRLLLQTLFKYHVKPFDPIGDRFDPNRHEALYQVPVPDKKPGTVIDCQKLGYTIKDRILRAAQVGVAQEVQGNQEARSTS